MGRPIPYDDAQVPFRLRPGYKLDPNAKAKEAPIELPKGREYLGLGDRPVNVPVYAPTSKGAMKRAINKNRFVI
jgi:hypothetical protein